MLERLLAFRLRRLVVGEQRPGDWLVLARVLRRSARPTPSVSSMAVSLHRAFHLQMAVALHRPVHLHVARPIAVRLDLHATTAIQHVAIPVRAAPRLVVRSFTMQPSPASATVSPTGANAIEAFTSAITPTRTSVQSIPRVNTVVSRSEWSAQPRPRRWLAQYEERRSMRPVVANALRPGEPVTLPFSKDYPAPQRVLSRPVRASGAPEQMLLPPPDDALRYWTDSRALSSATSAAGAPDLNLLTEHVLRNVDQRLVAARERMSRVTKG